MNRVLKIFLLTQSILIFGAGMMGPIYAIFVQEIGGDILVAGASGSVFLIVTGAGIYVMGRIQDLIREKPVILGGYLMSSLAILGYAFVSNPLQLFAVQILLGLACAVATPGIDAWYTKLLDRGKFASQWAAWESVYYIAGGTAALLGSFLAGIYGFRMLFYTMFVISLAGTVMILKVPEGSE
jgi:MFS family permease